MIGDVLVNIIAAGIGGIIAITWQRWLFPNIIQTFAETTKLASEYKGRLDFGRGPNHEITLRLKKLGYRVEGLLRFTEGRHKGKEYYVKGRYSHGLLTFTYWPVDKISTSQGTATYQRMKDGELLHGYFAYYSQESDKVSTVLSELTIS